MQQGKKMDLRQVEVGMKVLEDGRRVVENKANDHEHQQQLDPGSALQTFLDRIPISSIPGIQNSPVVELKAGDGVKDAIQLLYEENVSGAPIADVVESDATVGRISDHYMGFIDFVSLFLWFYFHKECEKVDIQAKKNGGDETGRSSFFTMLEQSPEIGQTKVGELAKSFLWDPFFPVNLDNTLFHVLMLLSKHHRLQAVPVIEQSDFQIIGFVTQNAVIQLLLQSSGLEWFDGIADKALSEFRFDSEGRVILVYEDHSLAEAIHILWESRIGSVAVVNRETKKLIGCLRNSDVYLLLENNELFNDRRKLTMGEFIHTATAIVNADPTIEPDLEALRLRSSFLPRMYSPVTAKRSNTLKQAMNKLADAKGSFCFLVDDSLQPTGMLTLRDIIIQFSPPCIDSAIHGALKFNIPIFEKQDNILASQMFKPKELDMLLERVRKGNDNEPWEH
ncbi:hypothetical protein GH714_030009 [Hevea brasiliensis]|uniref:CBS domain-containing protein n=1 Tax=Hevea brasiliensis TaxID=3981 RepID=A0A6A6LLI6_HEVBR|nr:hypothetical protein GH714_030009 [Hevea brasiliensis]